MKNIEIFFCRLYELSEKGYVNFTATVLRMLPSRSKAFLTLRLRSRYAGSRLTRMLNLDRVD